MSEEVALRKQLLHVLKEAFLDEDQVLRVVEGFTTDVITWLSERWLRRTTRQTRLALKAWIADEHVDESKVTAAEVTAACQSLELTTLSVDSTTEGTITVTGSFCDLQIRLVLEYDLWMKSLCLSVLQAPGQEQEQAPVYATMASLAEAEGHVVWENIPCPESTREMLGFLLPHVLTKWKWAAIPQLGLL